MEIAWVLSFAVLGGACGYLGNLIEHEFDLKPFTGALFGILLTMFILYLNGFLTFQ